MAAAALIFTRQVPAALLAQELVAIFGVSTCGIDIACGTDQALSGNR